MSRAMQNNQRVNLRLPAALARQARRKAKIEKRPLSDVIRELLRDWVAQATQ